MDRQALAKLGVVVLVGLNIGGYYLLWPRHDASPQPAPRDSAVKREASVELEQKREMPPLPRSRFLAIPEAPERNVRESVVEPPPLPSIPEAPAIPVKKDEKTQVIGVLLQRIVDERQTEKIDMPAPSPAKIDLPVLPPPRAPSSEIAIALPLTPKMPAGRWLVQTEKSNSGTQLTARLRDAGGERTVAEFRIQCNRTETDPQTGDVRATGDVRFQGAGWKGTCGVLTLPIQEPRMILEQQVQVAPDVLGGSEGGNLTGERIVWQLPYASQNPAGVTAPLDRR